MTDAVANLTEQARHAIAAVKPKLRGWQHAGAIPVAVILGLILVWCAPSDMKVPAAIYAVSCVALFSISATYHRGSWSPRTHSVLKRMDHATIFLLIAGSYTAFICALLSGTTATVMLWAIWITAGFGMAFRILWPNAPRGLTVPVYIGMGWAAVLLMPQIWRNGGVAIFLLLAAGGLFYSVGAVIYGLRRPNPSPKWFGFHEIFHSCTLGGFLSHYIGISLAMYTVATVANA